MAKSYFMTEKIILSGSDSSFFCNFAKKIIQTNHYSQLLNLQSRDIYE